MTAREKILDVGQIGVVLRGEPELMNQWVQEWSLRRMLLHVVAILPGRVYMVRRWAAGVIHSRLFTWP